MSFKLDFSTGCYKRGFQVFIFNDEDQEVFLDDYETASNFAY